MHLEKKYHQISILIFSIPSENQVVHIKSTFVSFLHDIGTK